MAKRHYKDWYHYESRKTTVAEGLWMTFFTVVLCIGFPLAFAAMYHYAVPYLFGLV